MSALPKRYGVLGGTFDPPHVGHLHAATVAADALNLSEVVFVPAARNPHKSTGPVASDALRLAMLRAAIAVDPRFVLSDVDLRRPPPSYAIDTLAALGREHPGRPVLILGADAWSEIARWRQPLGILAAADLAVIPRAGMEPAPPTKVLQSLEPIGGLCYHEPRDNEPWVIDLRGQRSSEVFFLRAPALNVSSSDLRRRARTGPLPETLVPASVARLIRDHHIYD